MNEGSLSELPLLLELLLARRLIESKGVELALRELNKRSCSLEEAVLHTRLVSETTIAKVYSEHLLLPLVTSPEAIDPADEDLKTCLAEKFARDNHILPLMKKNGVLAAAFLDPTDLSLVQEVQFHTGLGVNVHVGTLTAILLGLDALFGPADTAREVTIEVQETETEVARMTEEEILDLDRVIAETRETRIIRLVNRILQEAIRENASDIHLEPYPNECKVRYRIDGVLHDIRPPQAHLFIPLLSRLKILCKMDIAEKRIPQDGAFSIKLGETLLDVRVSTLPTVHGEKMVMRILNKGALPLDMEALGLDSRQSADYLAAANAPHGLLFVTGPTGSGKSTTLYATLNLIKSPKKNILTVEDPVEYKFAGINQVQVKPQVDLTFSRALRAFLRQDPDIIMVGEVRDPETAQICLRAALTGHLVLSTLHTNDALAATTRLADMGIEPFLLAATLRAVEAQRLIRRLCQKCREPFTPSQELVEKYGLGRDVTLYEPRGCRDCRDSGYKGRIGLFEVIRVTPGLRDLIEQRASLLRMREEAQKEGFQSLLASGMEKVKQGVTSLRELLSVTLEGE